MSVERLQQQVDAHQEILQQHARQIAILEKQADLAERNNLRAWDKFSGLESHMQRSFSQMKDESHDQYKHLMEAITANKQAASILRGERGATKWILGMLATAVMAITGIIHLAGAGFRWLMNLVAG